MEFLTYPSIEQLYKTLEVVEHGEVIATEKLHGTNARVEYVRSGDTWGIRVGSRNQTVSPADPNSHMGFTAWVLENRDLFNKALDSLEYGAEHGDVKISAVTFFGEWVGKGIQKGVNYCEGKDFYLFGVTVRVEGEEYPIILSYDQRKRVAIDSGLKIVPVLFRGTVRPEDAIKTFDEVIASASEVAAKNGLESVMEGVVIEPAIPCRNKFGHPLLAKHKAEKFMEVAKSKSGGQIVTPEEGFLINVGNVFARTFITPERVNHVLDQCRERGEEVKGDMSDMRFLVKAVMTDVEKECADALIFLDALVERKKVSKQITRRISNLYEEMLRAAELEKHLSTVG